MSAKLFIMNHINWPGMLLASRRGVGAALHELLVVPAGL
jgi:hypothetical protein